MTKDITAIISKLQEQATSAIATHGIFLIGVINTGIYTVGASYDSEKPYELALPYVSDPHVVNAVFANKEIKHGDVVTSENMQVLVDPEDKEGEKRFARYQVIDTDDTFLIDILTKHFTLGWNGNIYKKVNVKTARLLVFEDSKNILPLDQEDFSLEVFITDFLDFIEKQREKEEAAKASGKPNAWLDEQISKLSVEERKAYDRGLRYLKHEAVVGKYYTGRMTRRDLTPTDQLVLINRYKAAKRRKTKQQRK